MHTLHTLFNPNDCSKAIICDKYPEVPLHTRINNKGLMLPALANKVTPYIGIFLADKYRTRNRRGELKQVKRMLDQMKSR